ncbi:hypothetical protein BZA05DRAFT_276226 [Tricharina praecox]|uniref:uncharacterized protein n=1 Tax=Tricharina praecox TaxID=43433 RepID=UPI00221FB8F9|nr:uncharacterized protein BZA05DRAFT_276226 [Tricharina praecox]KAI5853981.1 hypothetical protein BZA05DRAFT_276226 [Tricharina praecox]
MEYRYVSNRPSLLLYFLSSFTSFLPLPSFLTSVPPYFLLSFHSIAHPTRTEEEGKTRCGLTVSMEKFCFSAWIAYVPMSNSPASNSGGGGCGIRKHVCVSIYAHICLAPPAPWSRRREAVRTSPFGDPHSFWVFLQFPIPHTYT